MMFSLYPSIKSRQNEKVDVDGYISIIKTGSNYQDLIFKARALKQKSLLTDNAEEKKDLDIEYKELKNKQAVITGSGFIPNGEPRKDENISLNGLIVIDIDGEQVDDNLKAKLQLDDYTFIMHESFGGGNNYCIFVKIKGDRFEDSFNGLAEHYYKNYNIAIDQACKDKSRPRFLSFDPNIYYNPNSNLFRTYPKKEKPLKKEDVNYVFFEDDFNHIMDQIQEISIDLVKGDYSRYIRIGFALFSKFGEAGEQYFKIINIYNPNQNRKQAHREWRALCKNGTTNIGTFYYYCKEEGIDIYSQKSKDIINSVATSKATGNPTVESITKHVGVTYGHEVSTGDIVAIEELILKTSVELKSIVSITNKDLTEIEILEKFIIDTYNPISDVISKTLTFTNKAYDDNIVNDICISAKKSLDIKVNKQDVEMILFSSSVKQFDILKDLIANEYDHENPPKGHIDSYIECVNPCTEYEKYFFKKWYIGMVYNWFGEGNFFNDISELLLVLISNKMGTGKTTFFKMLLPKELQPYFSDEKLKVEDKDTMLRMTTNLLVLDDEFGGKSFKNDEELKALTSKPYHKIRRPFRKADETFRRMCGLAGTSNKKDILKDPNGNRRIIPINIRSINLQQLQKVDTKKMIIEAYHELQNGFDYKVFLDADVEFLNSNTEQNNVILPLYETFTDFFSDELIEGTEAVVVNQGQIKNFLTGVVGIINAQDFKNVMDKFGVEYKVQTCPAVGKLKRGFKVYVKPDINNYCKNGLTILPIKHINNGVPF